MKKHNQVKRLILELQKVPDRTQCNLMGEVALRAWYYKNQKDLKKYLYGVKLKAEEIPDWAWFKIILLIILNMKWVNHEMQGIPNKKVWDMQDPDIRERLKIIKNDVNVVGDFYQMPLCNFIYFSKYCHRRI